MSRRRFSNISSLIADLLDRHERSPGATRLLAPIDNDGFESVDQRDAFDDELASLEREGGVELVRTGHLAERVVTSARLKNPAALYRRAGRRPSGQVADDALSGLRARTDLPEGAETLIDAAARAWSRGVSHLGIANGDVKALGHVIQLAAAVYARMAEPQDGEIDYRTFSRLTVKDSKALERNVRQVASTIACLFPAKGSRTGLNPDELLAGAGIVRMPQPVLIRGSLEIDGQALPELPFVGFPTESAGRVNLRELPTYVLTIENYASFVRHVREVGQSDGALVIYSGGFPSRPTLKAIARLAGQAKAPVFHWGDMDAGGVRIFRHIERHLAPLGVALRPHMMDADLLRRAGTVVPNAPAVVGDMTGSAIADLAQVIRETGLVHEQEEFSPRSPLHKAPCDPETEDARAISPGRGTHVA
ncbi:MAG: Wadjet anti-phage system protein JetD domain-containing protein [Devosia sp.]